MNFFRKYQRPILFTAVMFALLTFSVTADMADFFGGLFRRGTAMPEITVEGRKVNITEDDQRVAMALKHLRSAGDVVVVMPSIDSFDRGKDDFGLTAAALRRQAIEAGIDASYDEVDKAIGAAARNHDAAPRDLGRAMSTFAAYRSTVYEELRVATLIRTEALGTYPFDHQMAERALADKELLTLRVAMLDKKAIEAEQGTALDASGGAEQKLRDWLAGLKPEELKQHQFTAPSKFRLQLLAVSYADFDPAQFEAELAGTTFGDAEVQQFYDANRIRLYLNKPAPVDPNPPTPPTPDLPKYRELDDTLNAEIKKRLQADAALAGLWTKTQAALFTVLLPATDARTAAFEAMNKAEVARDTAKAAAAADAANTDLAAAQEAAEQSFEQAKTAHEAAQKAVEEARAAWDATPTLTELIAGKTGFRLVASGDAPVEATELKTLADLGEWLGFTVLNGMPMAGLFSQPQSTKEHGFDFRVVEVVKDPPRDFADIQDKVRAKYLAAEADKVAADKKKKLEDAIDRLAREKVATEIAEIESKRTAKVDEQLTAWRTDLQGKIDAAQQLFDTTPSERARESAQRRLEQLRAQLAGEDTKKKELETAIEAETKDAVAKALAKSHLEILDTAAAEAGFAVSELGPVRRHPTRRGPPQSRPPIEQALIWTGRVGDIEKGGSTGVVDDATQRLIALAVCTDVRKATVDDLDRRDMLESIAAHRSQQMIDAVRQSYTKEALQKRLGWTEPGEEKIQAASTTPPPGTPMPPPGK